MADNTTINPGSGGDVIRTVAKVVTSAKTQVILIDLGGGADADPENIAKGSLPTTSANPAAIVAGRQLTTTGAVVLPTQALVNGVVIKALSTNVSAIYLGPSGVTTATGYPLFAGESISYGVTNLNAIYLIGANTTDSIAYTGN